MALFLNPILLLFISFMISFMEDIRVERIIAILLALIMACCSYLFTKRLYRIYFAIFYCILCCVQYDFLFFLPVVIYMVCEKTVSYRYVVLFIPFLFHLQDLQLYVSVALCIETIFAIILKLQYEKHRALEEDYRKQRDATKELALRVSAKNKDLIIQQEQEIRIATLAERNRIAREIHDNVGHLLSSALIQMGALQVITQEEPLQVGLSDLRDTISTAMDSVRESVHDLHAESLDLQLMIQKVIDQFSFCEVRFEYDMLHSFHQNVIYHIVAIVKECLHNTMKHSNATIVHVVVREQPAFFQIICMDNGTKSAHNQNGIGLFNIQERIDSLHGYVNISSDKGFKVFMTLPKEDTICEL